MVVMVYTYIHTFKCNCVNLFETLITVWAYAFVLILLEKNPSCQLSLMLLLAILADMLIVFGISLSFMFVVF